MKEDFWIRLRWLGSAVVFLLIIAIPFSAKAKVTGHVTQYDDELYEFDYDSLLRAFVFDQSLYSEYLKGETIYLLDDVNGYIDYNDALRAFVFSNNDFNLDSYT